MRHASNNFSQFYIRFTGQTFCSNLSMPVKEFSFTKAKAFDVINASLKVLNNKARTLLCTKLA